VKFLCVAAILSAKFMWEKYSNIYQAMTRRHSYVMRLPCGIKYPVSASCLQVEILLAVLAV
jgi:hypothetical protein